MALGKLKKVDVREEWKHEANDFTKWLSQEESLRLLGNEIGYDIVLLNTEAACGDFNVDILAEEESTKKKIIIENQLEITDHDHLGKLITYASGHVASIAIWVVRDVREEHRKAVDWLNEHTDEDLEFYLVQIELLQIDESPCAPHFEIICKPNDWARTVKGATGPGALTGTSAAQFEFWTQFKAFAIQNKTMLKPQKPSPQHWNTISIGSSQACISLTINSIKGLFATELYIYDNKELYAQLLAHKTEIESDLGSPAEWMELPGKKASRIKVSISGDFNAKEKWNDYFKWLLEEAEKFYKTFPKYLNLAGQ
jgi:hypothetical protein